MDRIDKLTRLLEAEPNDAFCLYGLAQEYGKVGRFEEAVAMYDRTLSADPDTFYAYFHKARCLDELGRREEAIATLRAGLQRSSVAGDAKAASEIRGLLDELT